jgi:lysophospholipase L1-like esterase
MQRFFRRLPTGIILAAELLFIAIYLTMSAYLPPIADTAAEEAPPPKPVGEIVIPKKITPKPEYTFIHAPEPEPEPEPIPEPEHEPIISVGVPESARAEDSYFDDAVFIGDSVTVRLDWYVREKRQKEPDLLGKSQFLAAVSYGYINALKPISDDVPHLTYQGEAMSVADAVAATGAKKLYIMLGLNDISGGRYDATLELLSNVVSRIQGVNPDAEFYFQSITPRMENSQTTKLTNDIIRGYNEKLLKHCEDNGYYFIDVYSVLCDENGNLPAEYCSDPISPGGTGMGIHFTNEACEKWIEYLYTHTV